jgi:hypothetical protein
MLLVCQQQIAVIGPSGQHRRHARAANALLAGGLNRYARSSQGLDNRLIGIDLDRRPRLREPYPKCVSGRITRGRPSADGPAVKYSKCSTRPGLAATASRTACMKGPGPQA